MYTDGGRQIHRQPGREPPREGLLLRLLLLVVNERWHVKALWLDS